MQPETIHKSDIEHLREWFRDCPALQADSRFNVDFLAGNPTEYALYQVPSTLQYRENVLGERMLRDVQTIDFIFASMESYSSDVVENMVNAQFYEAVLQWILQQNKSRNYPEINGGEVRSIVPTLTAYPADIGSDAAKYQIQLEISYRIKE